MSDLKFTDDQLKELKADVEPCHDWTIHAEKAKTLKALLARLEAAEAWAKAHQSLCAEEKNCPSLKIWEKAVGK